MGLKEMRVPIVRQGKFLTSQQEEDDANIGESGREKSCFEEMSSTDSSVCGSETTGGCALSTTSFGDELNAHVISSTTHLCKENFPASSSRQIERLSLDDEIGCCRSCSPDGQKEKFSGRHPNEEQHRHRQDIMDRARQTMDDAIGMIKREVKFQREKSNTMCQLRTAHNWAEDKENVIDLDSEQINKSFFMRAHTVTVLIILICILVYVGIIEEQDEEKNNMEYNGRRGLMAALFFWVALGMTIMPDGPFMRPHPVVWRLAFAVSIVYELLMIFILFQSASDARKLLKFLDDELGEEIPEKDYGGNCRIYDFENPHDPYHNLKDKVDVFIFAHSFGYWAKTLIFRDWWLTTVISISFEFLEYSLEHQLPNFSECWWDHWILDVIVCNGIGTVLGLLTLRYLSMKTYNWRGLYNIPTYRGKIKRIIAQFSPHAWIEFTWNPLSSLERWLAVIGIIFVSLITELNTFYLKFVLWFPPEHWLNGVRLSFMLLWGAVGLREIFQLLDDPECEVLGRQSWVLAAIIATELLVCVKFGWSTITKPLPQCIAFWWLGAIVLLVTYTFIKFVIFKPTHLPRPEKEQVRLSPIHSGGVYKKGDVNLGAISEAGDTTERKKYV